MASLTLTGKLGSTPSCLGAFVLGYAPLPTTPDEEEEEEVEAVGWTRAYERKLEEKELERRRKREEEEAEILAVMITLLS